MDGRRRGRAGTRRRGKRVHRRVVDPGRGLGRAALRDRARLGPRVQRLDDRRVRRRVRLAARAGARRGVSRAARRGRYHRPPSRLEPSVGARRPRSARCSPEAGSVQARQGHRRGCGRPRACRSSSTARSCLVGGSDGSEPSRPYDSPPSHRQRRRVRRQEVRCWSDADWRRSSAKTMPGASRATTLDELYGWQDSDTDRIHMRVDQCNLLHRLGPEDVLSGSATIRCEAADSAHHASPTRSSTSCSCPTPTRARSSAPPPRSCDGSPAAWAPRGDRGGAARPALCHGRARGTRGRYRSDCDESTG